MMVKVKPSFSFLADGKAILSGIKAASGNAATATGKMEVARDNVSFIFGRREVNL